MSQNFHNDPRACKMVMLIRFHPYKVRSYVNDIIYTLQLSLIAFRFALDLICCITNILVTKYMFIPCQNTKENHKQLLSFYDTCIRNLGQKKNIGIF